MTSDMTGEVRCPSCGRPTSLAPFCTHCGAVIPEGASGPRAHAMDREQLEERARQLHGSGSPFRRGGPAGDAPPGDTWGGPPTAGSFVPEPSDELARRADAASADPTPRVDYFDDRPAARPDPASVAPSAAIAPAYVRPNDPEPYRPPAAAPVVQPPEHPADSRYGGEPGYDDQDRYDAPDKGGAYGAGGYGRGGGYDDPGGPGDGGPRRRSGALPIIGFVVLGAAALLGGAILFSALNAEPGVAGASASPTPSEAASAGASEPAASALDSSEPTVSGQPSAGTSPDNFTARVQPCASNDMGFSGCTKDGTTLTGSQVWVWVGFKNAQAANVLGVTIEDKSSGSSVGDGSLELDKLTGCDPGKTCSGYIQMTFGDLSAGSYSINVTRDGTQVATVDFTVSA